MKVGIESNHQTHATKKDKKLANVGQTKHAECGNVRSLKTRQLPKKQHNPAGIEQHKITLNIAVTTQIHKLLQVKD